MTRSLIGTPIVTLLLYLLGLSVTLSCVCAAIAIIGCLGLFGSYCNTSFDTKLSMFTYTAKKSVFSSEVQIVGAFADIEYVKHYYQASGDTNKYDIEYLSFAAEGQLFNLSSRTIKLPQAASAAAEEQANLDLFTAGEHLAQKLGRPFQRVHSMCELALFAITKMQEEKSYKERYLRDIIKYSAIVIEKYPDYLDAMILRTFALYYLGESYYQSAWESVQECLDLDYSNASIHDIRSEIVYSLDRHGRGLEQFLEARDFVLRLDPDYLRSYWLDAPISNEEYRDEAERRQQKRF
jgi:hypothetical protein